MGSTRRRFTKEFKQEAVRLVTEGGQSLAQVDQDLGVRDSILGPWKKEAEKYPMAAFPGHSQLRPEDAELRRLRRENERLRMEWDILKKQQSSSLRNCDEICVYSESTRSISSSPALSGAGSGHERVLCLAAAS